MQRIFYISGIGLAAILALILRLPGLDPSSLWLDDQWVGITVTRMGWSQLLELRPPVPLGFVAISKFFAAIIDDPEIALQLFPLICAIVLVPVLATLVTRSTERYSLGILAATLIALSPDLVGYSVAAKHYSADALSTTLLLLLGLRLLDRWDERRSILFAGVSLGLLPLSFPSALVATPLLTLAALGEFFRSAKGQPRRWRPLVIAAGFGAALATVYALLLAGQANEELLNYWTAYFMPLSSITEALQFARVNFTRFVGGAMPHPRLCWVVLLVIPTIVVLLIRKSTRAIGIFAALFYLQMLVVSAFELYPLGTGRTDIFSYPLTLLVLCLGLHAIASRVRESRIPAGVFLAASFLAAAICSQRVSYGITGGYMEAAPCEDAELVAKLSSVLREEDALLVDPLGSFALGYYGPWELDVLPFAGFSHGFEVQLQRPATRTLPGCAKHMQRPDCFEPALDAFLSEHRDRRIVLFASFLTPPVYAWYTETMSAKGFAQIQVEQTARARILVYEAK